MKPKNYCHAQRRLLHTNVIVECERKKGHKKKHKCAWVDGTNGEDAKVKVTWSE